MQLLDRDALGEVSGLVDVVAADDGGVVGDELQGDDGEHGGEGLGDVGDVEDVFGDFFDVGIALGGDGDDVAAAGADLGDVVEDLVVLAALVGDEDGGHAVVDEGDGAVLHFGGGH